MRNTKLQARSRKLNQRGVALVITLLMLSVITFMTIAFLAVSRRERASVSGALNQIDAQAMADAALARAQADLAAYLMANNPATTNKKQGRPDDLLNYDMMMSHNFINPIGFMPGIDDPTNVNFDYYNGTGKAMTSSNSADWIENIANLLYDPRVPVFVPDSDQPDFGHGFSLLGRLQPQWTIRIERLVAGSGFTGETRPRRRKSCNKLVFRRA